jgi:hypothetical protein
MQKTDDIKKINSNNLFRNLFLFLAILFLCLISFIAFKLFQSNQVSDMVASQEISEQKKAEQIIIKSKEIKLEKNNLADKNTLEDKRISCCFVKDYYSLRLKAIRYVDFSEDILNLTNYNISSPEIVNLLSKLSILAAYNHNKQYFFIKLDKLVHEIYQLEKHKESIVYRYLGQYFQKLVFIRPVRERALKGSAIEKNLELSINALQNFDIEKAIYYLDQLPDYSADIKDFREELHKKLLLDKNFSALDDIINIQLNCKQEGQ